MSDLRAENALFPVQNHVVDFLEWHIATFLSANTPLFQLNHAFYNLVAKF